MEGISSPSVTTGSESGFSVIMAERVLRMTRQLGIRQEWKDCWLGHPSGRVSAYSAPERIAAVLAGLAVGLRGIAEGNRLLRGNSALRQETGGSFPDQGTIHRWLQDTLPEQAQAVRTRLQTILIRHGQFWNVLRSEQRLVVDLDGQGLLARGNRFEGAVGGHLGGVLDKGYQRYVAYVGQTREVLDEFLASGNTTLMTTLPELLKGLNAVFAAQWRERVLLRVDAHGGTAANIQAMQQDGYRYVCRLQSQSAQKRLVRHLAEQASQSFCGTDSAGRQRAVEFWEVQDWTFRGRRGDVVQTRAVVFREPGQQRQTWVLLTNLSDLSAAQLWECYHQRGGTIEEYLDQSEQAFHLDVIRSGSLAGLNAFHALLALCWNLITWSTSDLALPPAIAPHAEPPRWLPAKSLSLEQLLRRASQSGLKLFRSSLQAILEIEQTTASPETTTWLRWLKEAYQPRLLLAG